MKLRLQQTLIFIFILINLWASFNKSTLYPFNSYQMFSKDLLKQGEVAGMEVIIENNRRPVWKMSDNPFFQVNRVALNTYYDNTSDKDKEAFCQWVRRKVNASEISFDGVMKKYERPNRILVETDSFREKVYKCKG